MLYERWLEVVRAHPDRLALWDAAGNRRWTFAELADAAVRQSSIEGPTQFANTAGASFLLSVLTAWRDGKVLVPLEPGQPKPEFSAQVQPGIIHLKTTSATTGASRMIGFTEEQLVADCENIVATMGLSSGIPNVGAISLAHSYGFSNLVLPLFLEGVPLLLAESALPESVRATMDQAAAVALPAVPALWQTWLEAGILSNRVRIAISAGAPLPLGLEQRVFDTVGIKIHNFYGSSECGGIAYDRSETPRTDATLAGLSMVGVQISLNEEGCITVRSRAVGVGYWPEPDHSLAAGCFQTGDLGEIIEGSIHLRGRACDRINVAGRKVIPEEVERVLTTHPAVKDCLVFGIPSGTLRNETIVACVVADANGSPRELTEFLQSRLHGWQIPREWWMVDSLATNERGKRSRSAWRRRFIDKQTSCRPNDALHSPINAQR